MRPNRELWLWAGGLFLTAGAFLDAVGIAYFLKEPRYSLFGNPWVPTAILSLLLAFAAFFGATRSWALPAVARAGFPDVTIEVNSVGSTDIEREAASGLDVPAHLRSFQVRLTSMEAERSASLTVQMYVKLTAGTWGRAAEALCPVPDWKLSPSLGLSPMPMPVDLGPGEETSGQLAFEIPRYYLTKLTSPVDARLEITDQSSGRHMSIPAELGRYDRSAMTPAKGGAQMLGPEYDAPLMLPAARPEEAEVATADPVM